MSCINIVAISIGIFFVCLCKECTKGVIVYTRLRQLHVPWVMNPLTLVARIEVTNHPLRNVLWYATFPRQLSDHSLRAKAKIHLPTIRNTLFPASETIDTLPSSLVSSTERISQYVAKTLHDCTMPPRSIVRDLRRRTINLCAILCCKRRLGGRILSQS